MKKWLMLVGCLCGLTFGLGVADGATVSNIQYNPSTETLSGTTSPNATVSVNGVAGSVISDGDGHFTIGVPSQFKSAELYVIDAEGNQQNQSVPISNNPNETSTLESSQNTSSSSSSSSTDTTSTTSKTMTQSSTSKESEQESTTTQEPAQTQEQERNTTSSSKEKQTKRTQKKEKPAPTKAPATKKTTEKQEKAQPQQQKETTQPTKQVKKVPMAAWLVIAIFFIIALTLIIFNRYR